MITTCEEAAYCRTTDHPEAMEPSCVRHSNEAPVVKLGADDREPDLPPIDEAVRNGYNRLIKYGGAEKDEIRV